MRYSEIVSVSESYESQVGLDVSKTIDKNLNIFDLDYAKESEQMANQFRLSEKELKQAVYQYSLGTDLNKELLDSDGDVAQLTPENRDLYTLLMQLPNIPLQEKHHVYSGTGTFDPRDVLSNNIFTSHAFISTSLSMEVASKTTSYRRKKSQIDHVMHFILPEGFSEGFYIAPYSHDPEELEFILFPEINFKYTKTVEMKLYGNITRYFHTFRSP